MKAIPKTLLALLLAGFAAASLADGFPVEIYGNFNTASTVGNVSSTVSGANARGDINVAGIQGNARVTGSYNATVQAGNISSNVQGDGASASINAGGVQTYRQ
jgi:hypothetical protein